MVIQLEEFTLNTHPEGILNITSQIRKKLSDSGLTNGFVCEFTASSTSILTTTEYESRLITWDMPYLLEKIRLYNRDYDHHHMWEDKNGGKYMRSFLLGPTLTIPFSNSELILGTWQKVIILDMDEKNRI